MTRPESIETKALSTAVARTIVCLGLLAFSLGWPAEEANAQAQTIPAGKACNSECQALKKTWREASQTAKVQRTEIEQIGRDLAGMDQEWSRLAKTSNRQTRTINRLWRRAELLTSNLRTAENDDEKAKLTSALGDLKPLITELETQFFEIRKKLDKIDAGRNAIKRRRGELLELYKISSDREKAAKATLDRHLNPNAPSQPTGIYASFQGSFDRCLTYDRTVMAHKIDVSTKELNRYLNRKDKTRPPKEKALADVGKKLANGDLTNPSKSFPCPDLDGGHALSGGEVCLLWARTPPYNSSSVTPSNRVMTYKSNRGPDYRGCDYQNSGGAVIVLAAFLCEHHGKTKFGLTRADTSTFARWNAHSFDTVCFYFKKSDVASLIGDYRVSKEEKQLQKILEQIANISKYIVSEKALADKIENNFKTDHDPAGIDAAIGKLATLKSKHASEEQKEKQNMRDVNHAIEVHKELLAYLKTASTAPPDVELWVNSKIMVFSASALYKRMSVAKYAGLRGAIAGLVSIPAEIVGKEVVRSYYIGKTNDVLTALDGAKSNIKQAVNVAQGNWWAAHAKSNEYKDIAKQRDRHEIDASSAGIELQTLNLKKKRLETQIAQKRKSGN